MLYERELQLQREVAADAAAQKQAVRSLIERAKAGGIQHPRASAIVKSVLDNVVIELDLIKDDASRGIGGLYKNWLRAASSEVQALISIRECIRACSRVDKDPTVSSLCGDIGSLFELEVRIDEASQIDGLYIDRRMLIMQKLVQNQGDRKRLIKKAIEHVLQGHGKEFLNTSERAHLGKFGLNACINAGLVFVQK
jgi:DNA-directed RNA polymerase